MSAESPYSVSTLGPFDSSGYYNLAATTTVLLWDILITLPREKLYIMSYHAEANWTTLFYIITRYLPFTVNVICLLLLQFEQSVCTKANENILADGCVPYDTAIASLQPFAKTFTIFYTIPWFVVLACTEILFVRRTIALYNGSRPLSRILFGLLICELVSALFLLFYFTIFNESFPVIIASLLGPLLELSSEIPVFPPGAYFAFPELVFQAFLVMLIMKKVISDWKSGTARGNLGSILIRDGLWSHFCNLAGLLVILIQPAWLSGLFNLPNILWSYASFSITSSRLILNIRAAAANQPGALNDTSAGTRTRLTFTQNIKPVFGSTDDELSKPYHYHDLEHNSDFDD